MARAHTPPRACTVQQAWGCGALLVACTPARVQQPARVCMANTQRGCANVTHDV